MIAQYRPLPAGSGMMPVTRNFSSSASGKLADPLPTDCGVDGLAGCSSVDVAEIGCGGWAALLASAGPVVLGASRLPTVAWFIMSTIATIATKATQEINIVSSAWENFGPALGSADGGKDGRDASAAFSRACVARGT